MYYSERRRRREKKEKTTFIRCKQCNDFISMYNNLIDMISAKAINR